MLEDGEIQNFVPKITVMGVGGAGCNAINNMLAEGIDGVEFVAANTDAQSLVNSAARIKLQIGRQTTRGFGAGAKPEVGQAAAEESAPEIAEAVKDSNIVFLTGGMGGGTGSGAMPVIASLAKAKGVLTIAIVTTPFDFEGARKKRIADEAIARLFPNVDSLIVLPNQNLYDVSDRQLSFMNAFRLSDSVLYEGVRNITDLVMKPGLINLDFADVRALMEDKGRSIIGVASERGENRASRAVEGALSNPLLGGAGMRGARGVLVNITGNPENLSLEEVGGIMDRIRSELGSDEANLAFGTCLDSSMGDALKVAVIATGIGGDAAASVAPAGESPFALSRRVDPLPHDPEPAPLPPSSVVGGDKLGSFFASGDEGDIQDFIDEEAEKFRKSTELKVGPFDGAPDDDPEPSGGKRKNPLSDFFSMIGKDSDDTFFDDAGKIDGADSMRAGMELAPSARREPDNVVPIAGAIDDEKRDGKQIDLMEMIRKMEETLEIPAIFKK